MRTLDYPVIIRAVNMVDAMTATIERIGLATCHRRLRTWGRKEVKNVNRVCYDISPKPTATIEWGITKYSLSPGRLP